MQVYSEVLYQLEYSSRILGAAATDLTAQGESIWGRPEFHARTASGWKRYRKSKRVYSRDLLVLSRAFALRYSELQEALESLDFEDLLPPEELEKSAKMISVALHDLEALARSEISTKR